MIVHLSHPTLLGIPVYLIFYFGGSFLSLFLAYRWVSQSSQLRHVHYFDLIWLTWLMGILGAKFFSLWLTPGSLSDTLSRTSWVYVMEGGYHLFGGIIIGSLGFLGLSWKWQSRVSFWKAVMVLLGVALPGLAVGRIGCIFSGCCFGELSTRGWILFQYDTQKYIPLLSQGTRIPTQLYNSLGVGVLTFGLWIILRRKQWAFTSFKDTGGYIAGVLTLFGLFRFVESFFRDGLSRTDHPVIGLYVSQWSSLGLLILGLVLGSVWLVSILRSSR